MSLRLIGSTTSPYVRKARIVMAEKKIECRFEIDDVWDSQTTISRHNPLGKVPCLVMEDDTAVYDSRVIVEYLDTLTPVSKLIPTAGKERVVVRTWEALADGLCDAAIAARLEQTWPGRTDEQRCQAWVTRHLVKIQNSLRAMSEGLGEKPWCFGNSYTLADISVCVALGYLDLRFSAINWRDNDNLAKLYDKVSQKQSFIDTEPPKV
jgi:glutathione S-transferase